MSPLSCAVAVPAGQRAFAAHRQCNSSGRAAPRALQHVAATAAAAGSGEHTVAAADAAPAAAAGSKRQLLTAAGLLAAAPLLRVPAAAAAEPAASSSSSGSGRLVFFELAVDRKPFGRFVVEVPRDAPAIGGQRFLDLAQGKEGVQYRRTKFELIEDGFVQNSGVKELSRVASGHTAITGGLDTELLEEELAAQAAAGAPAHAAPGLVSLLVLPRIEIVSKDKLVASKGKFITVTETFGEIPNGSAWAVTTRAMPELDGTHLVVGRVVQGMDVVEALAGLPRVADNTGSPYFQAGKALGDKRADVAQRAFNKPFSKIVVVECGFVYP